MHLECRESRLGVGQTGVKPLRSVSGLEERRAPLLLERGNRMAWSQLMLRRGLQERGKDGMKGYERGPKKNRKQTDVEYQRENR